VETLYIINIKSTHNANNGCLGDFGRRKTQTAAILIGEVLSTFDPVVSEWGNPRPLDVAFRKVSRKTI
jgi:hypothetical protein